MQPTLKSRGKKRAVEGANESFRKRERPTSARENVGHLALSLDDGNRVREKEYRLREETQLIAPVEKVINVLLAEYTEELDENEMTEALLTLEDIHKAKLFLLLHGKRDLRQMREWFNASARRR